MVAIYERATDFFSYDVRRIEVGCLYNDMSSRKTLPPYTTNVVDPTTLEDKASTPALFFGEGRYIIRLVYAFCIYYLFICWYFLYDTYPHSYNPSPLT